MGLGKKKKGAKNLPPPPGLVGLPLPPPPGAGLPLPPAPAMPTPPGLPAIANLPTSQIVEVPKMSLDLGAPAVEAMAPTAIPVVKESKEDSKDSSYSGLYAKKSGKPLQQVYGHIERIGTGNIGSLLDRYADRFGHQLDRDIIVMRKDVRDDRLAEIRDAPTIELVGADLKADDESLIDGETMVELNAQLKSVETELRRLKPEYQTAKADGDRELLLELRPNLEGLMAERKMIKAVMAGDADLDDLLSMADEEGEDDGDVEEYEHEDDDLFINFVSIVDGLLGNNLPEDAVTAFTETDGFEVYRNVGSDPANADESERAEFFAVVDALLGGMPEDAVSEFVNSDDFEIYRAVGAMYN
ncbi:MAG TPA: hypothetical protein EYQ73_07235 [Candidatus Poseidoniales archaeon]|nr:hypothetical protein [Candidatus Poseidoniales archaeon]HIL64584.1 hypothetical protein [Candidatus Poseidoniales archaeon]